MLAKDYLNFIIDKDIEIAQRCGMGLYNIKASEVPPKLFYELYKLLREELEGEYAIMAIDYTILPSHAFVYRGIIFRKSDGY